MEKHPANSPDTATWINESISLKDSSTIRGALLKYVKYKGLTVHNLKPDMDVIKSVVIFMGFESVKWRQISPQLLKFEMKAVTQIYESLRHMLQKPDELLAELEDTVVPDVCQWP